MKIKHTAKKRYKRATSVKVKRMITRKIMFDTREREADEEKGMMMTKRTGK